MSDTKIELCRREFMRIASMAAGVFALDACGSSGSDECDPISTGTCLPTLGGAPDNHDGHVIAAFVDTIVPGAHRDPSGAPGGIDVGAPGLFFDPALPALELVPILVAYLDGTSRRLMDGWNFNEIDDEQRVAVVDEALAGFAPAGFAVQLAKLAYFSSPEAQAHLGYPGPNAGYVSDVDFSFGVAMASEITTDGNLP